jgi:hypothetical protein
LSPVWGDGSGRQSPKVVSSTPANRKETDVAGRNQPSFLKRQKEQQRRARADEKRNRRLQRRRDKSEPAPEPVSTEAELPPVESDEPPTS